MRLFSKDGVELTDNDVCFLRPNDIVYLDLIGKLFNSAQVLDQYSRYAQLGLGGNVFQLQNKENRHFGVIKTVKFENNVTVSSIDDFMRHLSILKIIEHPNIIKMNHVFKLDNQVSMVMDFAKGSSIKEYLQGQLDQTLKEVEARMLIRQILRALDHCHQQGLAHQNLNLDNVFVTQEDDNEFDATLRNKR